MVIHAKPPGPIRMTDAAAPNGVIRYNMADTTNATYDGGIDVPHECLSGAKISIIHETSKLFTNYFSFETKITDADYPKPASETYRVLTRTMFILNLPFILNFRN